MIQRASLREIYQHFPQFIWFSYQPMCRLYSVATSTCKKKKCFLHFCHPGNLIVFNFTLDQASLFIRVQQFLV